MLVWQPVGGNQPSDTNCGENGAHRDSDDKTLVVNIGSTSLYYKVDKMNSYKHYQ